MKNDAKIYWGALERKLRNKPQIYLGQNFQVKEENELNQYQFVVNFIKYYNNIYHTYKTSGEIYCRANKRRSFGDIYNITKYYFPNTKPVEVITLLIFWTNNTLLNTKLLSIWCHAARKRTYTSLPLLYSGMILNRKIDEYDIDIHRYHKYIDEELIRKQLGGNYIND